MTDSAPRAVLFDLDDTLFNHLHSARSALVELSHRYPVMKTVPVRELERRYSEALESIHVRLLHGELSQTAARTQRMQQVFQSFDLEISDQQALQEYTDYRRDYDSVCVPVAGSVRLLEALRAKGIRLAVVTNNLVAEQIPKLQRLSLDHFFEVTAISEEVGVPKPDPKIFEVTLSRLKLSASDVVMVGDSLSSDIAGAVQYGIRSVWLRRYNNAAVSAPAGVAVIDEDFEDTEDSLRKLIGH